MAIGVTDTPMISPPLDTLDYFPKAAFARDYFAELMLRLAFILFN